MEFSAQNISEYLKGELEGDPNVKVSGVSKIEKGKKGTLAFLANPKYKKYIYDTDASIVLVNRDFSPERKVQCTLIKVDDAYQAFASLLELQQQEKFSKKGVEDMAIVSKEAKLKKDVYIGSHSYVSKNVIIEAGVKVFPQVFIGENVHIGSNTVIYPGVKIYENSVIGNNCVIHAGAIIGSDGFGFAPQSENGDYKKIPQVGNVIIEDNVEIGANTTIDRATFGSTVIRKGVKLDNLIQVAHNVEIGENSVLASQVGIAGSTSIGRDCMIGGQVGIIGHIFIADKVKIAAQTGISSSIKEEGAVIMGSPAINAASYHKSYAVFKKLPELYKQINQLEKQIQELKQQKDNNTL